MQVTDAPEIHSNGFHVSNKLFSPTLWKIWIFYVERKRH